MAFQVHQINAQVLAKTPTTRDPSPSSYSTLSQAHAAQLALGGKSDPINGAYWNSVVIDSTLAGGAGAVVIPLANDIDD